MVTKLKLLIVKSKMSQWEVAQAAGLHESLLSMYVCGRRNITAEHLRALSKVLGVSQKDLVGEA